MHLFTDSSYSHFSHSYQLSDSLLQDSFENATGFFTHQFLAASGKSYSDICFQPVSEEPSCFVASPSDSNVITLSFTPGTTDDFVTALKRPGLKDGDMNFVLETPESQSLSDMKNGRWVAYAAYTMVSRFWDLAKVRVLVVYVNASDSLTWERAEGRLA